MMCKYRPWSYASLLYLNTFARNIAFDVENVLLFGGRNSDSQLNVKNNQLDQ